jgi:RNase H-like domain found in reverse transcriptase
VIEINASNYALAAIVSQVESNGEIHLVTYLSWTFSDTELNYDTHDKELMAIYEMFILQLFSNFASLLYIYLSLLPFSKPCLPNFPDLRT